MVGDKRTYTNHLGMELFYEQQVFYQMGQSLSRTTYHDSKRHRNAERRSGVFFCMKFSVCVAYLLRIWYNKSVRKRNVGRAKKVRDGAKPP